MYYKKYFPKIWTNEKNLFPIFRSKTSVFCVPTPLPSTKKPKPVPIGATSIAAKRPYTMAAITSICTASVRAWKANGHHSPKKKRPRSICSELNQVSNLLPLGTKNKKKIKNLHHRKYPNVLWEWPIREGYHRHTVNKVLNVIWGILQVSKYKQVYGVFGQRQTQQWRWSDSVRCSMV